MQFQTVTDLPVGSIVGSEPRKRSSRRRSHEDFVRELSEVNPDVECLDTFTIVDRRMRFRCRKCGHVWETTAVHVLQGTGCPKCRGGVRVTHDEFVAKVSEESPDIEVIGVYRNRSTSVEVRCRKCGHVWNALPPALVRGTYCPDCSDPRRKSHEQFVTDLERLNPEIIVIGQYRTNTDRIRVRCSRCGHEWSPVSSYLLNKPRCPKCSRKTSSTSYLEQFFLAAFSQVFGEDQVLNRDRSALSGRELDVYIPSKDLAVEVGSWMRHGMTLSEDVEKVGLCDSRGISLVTVYDAVPDGVDPPTPRCLVYRDYLGDAESARRAVLDVMRSVGISADGIDWDRVSDVADFRTSLPSREADFLAMMEEKHPDVEVLGKFSRSTTKIEVRCRKCGHVWKATPSGFRDGCGCPKCAGNLKLTHGDFADRVRESNPSVEVVGDYRRMSEKVAVRCRTCGHVWDAFPQNVLRGHGCPECAKRNRGRCFRFSDFGIQIGDVVTYLHDPSVKLEVVTDRAVMYQGRKLGLSSVAKLLGWKKDGTVLNHWLFNGKTLYDLGQGLSEAL